MKRLLLLAIMLILILFTSCTENGAGIFYSIEIEEPIANDSLSDYLSATTVAIMGTEYYLPASRLFFWDSTSGATDWSGISLPSNWKITTQAASNGTTLVYFILENSDGDDSGLFIYNGTWNGEISVGTGRPYKVWFENSAIYVATLELEDADASLYRYRLYYSSDTAVTNPSFTQVQVGGTDYTTNYAIRDLDFDAGNGDVIFVSAHECAYGTGTAFTADATDFSSIYLRKLYYSTTFSKLYMTASDAAINGTGSIYNWNGAAWDTVDSSIGSDINDMCDITTNGGTDYLLIGNQSGYLESTDGTSFSGELATIDDNYDNTDLEGAVVNGFFDGPGDTFYAMTSGNGLWVNNGSGSWDLK